MEMGRKSACPLGAGTFGIGRIEACFHCRGTITDDTDILMSLVNGATETDNRKNQAGSKSRGISDVGLTAEFHQLLCSSPYMGVGRITHCTRFVYVFPVLAPNSTINLAIAN